MKKNSIKHYYKLITFLIVLSTVPVILVGVFSYLRSSEIIEANVAEEKQQSVYQIQTNVEQVLKSVDNSLTHFVRSPSTQDILRDPLNAEKFIKYHNIKQELGQLQTLETGIQDVIMVSLKHEWLINNNGLLRLEHNNYNKIHEKYMTYQKSSYWILEEYDDIVLTHDARDNCNYYINLIKKLPFLTSDKTGMVGALIPTCTLNNIMAEQIVSETFIILDESNQIIAHSDPDSVGTNINENEDFHSLIDVNTGKGQFNSTIEDIDYKVTYRTSSYNNWTYVSLVKISDLNKQSSSIGWFTLLVCSILLIISLIVAIIGISIFYKPIRHLQDFFTKTFTSAKFSTKTKNEFDLIRFNIEQMLDKNVELESRLQNQITQLRQFFIIRLLQGKMKREEIPAKLKSFNYYQSWTRLSLFTLQIDSLDESNYQLKEEDVILFAINAMIEDTLEEEIRFTPVVINRTQVTILTLNIESEEEYHFYLNELAQMIQSKIRKEFDLPVSIGISLPYTELISTKDAYKQGMESLKYRLKLGKESIIFYENLDRNHNFSGQLPTTNKNSIFDSIKVADREKADKGLKALFNTLFDKEFNHNQYQIFIIKFLYDLIELKQLLGVELKKLDERPLVHELENLRTSDDLQKWFKENLIYPIIEKVEERTESKYKTISDKIIHIIQKEYDTAISLDSIAARLHYNPNYLSSIFQKEMKTTFSEYLLKYRLNIAKNWLLDTDLSVKDIAIKLQYNNSQNFIRSFRKIEGITPGKYRMEHKKSG
ncbi:MULTISPECIES: helix-turn-helix domain-containing protein [Oceanobacillus]|uniref:HTH-type transcriptional regulator YtdP n=1 Tax=Oceanobacillus kimchii TaxID=746691 RepID=A0ABQ5TKS6_9BACI|nr:MULTISPECIES: helix-turn-helix domain-containing protein [Oceanobacillus]MBT2598152.1 helix-turn-helix domain-containing protein [Oceanobacillus sp. ISL-74]MBT2651071.1 helix-turn-helix domain-containing protein [Oceanobacillus sp. ISL-73]OEH55479.1 transcriptional regulator [Oceanobacillus sp. E9]GLO66752.1 putative HTH-type transcriptional regulator YtdP [Oceanobacillus kimchii]